MRKSKVLHTCWISFYFFLVVVIYTVIRVSVSPGLPDYRSASEVTDASSNILKCDMAYGTSSVDINIAGNSADKNIRIYDIYRSCNMSYSRRSHALPFHCSHLMTLARSIGRTGNQMFEYAALLGIAHRHNYTAVISPKFPLTNVFNLTNVAYSDTSDMIRLSEDKHATYEKKFEEVDTQHNYTLDGYFQSWRYFSEINNKIRSIYKVKDIYLKPALKFLKQISRQGRPNVCVHVRRGDFLSRACEERGYGVAGLGYIEKAMSYFKTKLNDPLFIVLSDDIRWCQSNLDKSNTVFSPFDKANEDLALMTLCDHAIVTSGTFGWWGAWLSNGKVVYYKDYPRPNSEFETEFNRHDYYPPSWVGLA